MDSALKQRLIGAAVLVALAMIFLPMLLRSPDPARQDAAQVPLDAPAAPDQAFQTREVPLALPAPAAARGESVTGAGPAVATDPTVTVDPDQAAPRVDFDPDAPVASDAAPGTAPADAPLAAIDPATGEPVAAEPEPLPRDPLPVTTAAGRYAVNVGSFSNLDNAGELAATLKAAGLPVTSDRVVVSGKPAMRLRVGPYAERTLAEAARLRVEGLSGGAATVIALDGTAAPAPKPAAESRPSAAGEPAGTSPTRAAGEPAATADTSVAKPVPTGRAPAAAGVGFAVQLGALSTEADANVLVGRAKSAGFIAFHQRVNTERGPVWRVRVGPEADRAAALRLRDDVAAKLGLADAIVVSHP